MVLEPFLGTGDGLLFFRCNPFIFQRGLSNGSRHGIDHGFQQAGDGVELRRGQLVNQVVCLPSSVAHTLCSGLRLSILIQVPKNRLAATEGTERATKDYSSRCLRASVASF